VPSNKSASAKGWKIKINKIKKKGKRKRNEGRLV